MRAWIVLGLLTTACSSAEISVSKTEIAWGEVDFNEIMPDEGYAAAPVRITNEGSKPIQVSILGIDDAHITVSAQVESSDPPTLPYIEPEQFAVIEVGVSGYEAGEWDSEVDGSLFVASNALKERVEITWTFTPTRIVDGD